MRTLTLEDRRKIELMWRRNASTVKIAAELEISQCNPNDFTLFLGDTPIARGEIQLAEITVPADTPKPETILPLQQMEFTVYFKVQKRRSCKSRKRFIKLMMSEGISRNYAERLADFVRGWMPYGKAWRKYLWQKL